MRPRDSTRPNPWIAFFSVALLFLATPLPAKCPRYSVDIRGKIECSLKSDDKVLVTLIFSDNHRVDPGEETAIEVHNANFAGRMSFDTHSSSTLLGGDRCHRRPKSVLIRLVESDGETDRTSLKIASDFSYDEKQGEYTLKSDLILHACPPEGDRPNPVPRARLESGNRATGFRKISASPVSR